MKYLWTAPLVMLPVAALAQAVPQQPPDPYPPVKFTPQQYHQIFDALGDVDSDQILTDPQVQGLITQLAAKHKTDVLLMVIGAMQAAKAKKP